MTCPAAEEGLIGGPATPEAFDAAARTVTETVDPSTDQRGPADYKRHLAGELTRRVLSRAAARARGGEH
jgi:carbon-monoxide dehydrogenase medium subunit